MFPSQTQASNLSSNKEFLGSVGAEGELVEGSMIRDLKQEVASRSIRVKNVTRPEHSNTITTLAFSSESGMITELTSLS